MSGEQQTESDEISKRLDRIEKLLEEIHEKVCKMDQHVDFVESVYDAVRNPMNLLFRTNTMRPPRDSNSRLLRQE
jgi:uncharacterized protein YoxC